LVIQVQFGGQFPRGLAFANTSQKHHDLFGRPSASLKRSPGVQIVSRVAATATIDNQFTVVSASKLAGLVHGSATVWTP
jgi:hypothetical protein